ncbi:hypothetical protein FDECE_11091 [Fusarium decemcellulare]|nr:hypothetical protein FDECE_11091 [Fusarium decemcellulare]
MSTRAAGLAVGQSPPTYHSGVDLGWASRPLDQGHRYFASAPRKSAATSVGGITGAGIIGKYGSLIDGIQPPRPQGPMADDNPRPTSVGMMSPYLPAVERAEIWDAVQALCVRVKSDGVYPQIPRAGG